MENNPLHSAINDFLIEYEDDLVLRFRICFEIINNTRFFLSIPGIYKINIDVLLTGLTVPESTYWVTLLGNNSQMSLFDRHETANPIISYFHYIDSSLYINNTGREYFEIQASCDDVSENFGITTTQTFNQLSIEYVIQ